MSAGAWRQSYSCLVIPLRHMNGSAGGREATGCVTQIQKHKCRKHCWSECHETAGSFSGLVQGRRDISRQLPLR